MPSSNKLAYLSSKYLTDSKKKKKKKHKKESPQQYDHDSDQDVLASAYVNGQDSDDNHDEEEEDGPVIVESQELVGAQVNDSLSATERSRRQRHDSSDSEPSASREQAVAHRRARHDSSSENEPRLARTASSRQRHDSSDEDETSNAKHGSRRRRYDSSDEEDSRVIKQSAGNDSKRHDTSSSDESTRMRKSEHRSHESRSRRRRHDSDSDDSNHGRAKHRRHKRTRHDSDDESGNDSDNARDRLSTGHKAGLQSSTEFAKQQAKALREKQKAAQATVDKHGMGETVYRDEHGRKQSVQSTQDAQEAARLAALRAQQEQLELQMGTKQKEELRQQRLEMERLAHSSFARHADDDELETLRKSAIREGDPMAAHAAKASRKSASIQNGGAPAKRLYSGPPPKPNRYGILPGYRWDGVDRGNGFEDKLLARQYMKQHQAEQAYIWSSRDM